MSKNQGSALLWLLYTVAIFTLLSSSLLKLALSDLRVSGHNQCGTAQYAPRPALSMRWRCCRGGGGIGRAAGGMSRRNPALLFLLRKTVVCCAFMPRAGRAVWSGTGSAGQFAALCPPGFDSRQLWGQAIQWLAMWLPMRLFSDRQQLH